MSVYDALRARVQRILAPSLVIGAAALLACILGAISDPAQFFRSYLFAYLFWLGIALGCLGVLMMHHLTGGAWGFAIRRMLEAAAVTLPLLAILFIPILLGMPHLFVWTHPDAMADPDLQHKSGFFLNVPWFIGRAVFYLVVWSVLAVLMRRWSLEQDRTGNPALTERFQHFCGPGLVLYVLTMSLAAIDWIMSLEPRWYSTIFGMEILCGQGVAAFSFILAGGLRLVGRKALKDLVSSDVFRDLGNMLLAFVVLWTYMAFAQYIIIWSGDVAKEAIWYLHRGRGGWPWIGRFLIGFHFLFPFLLLLFGNVKRNYGMLIAISAAILFAHLVDVFWLVMPSFYTTLHVHWMDVLAPIGIGGLWFACFAWQATKAAPAPLHDPRLAGQVNIREALERG